ncbi:hypothetical protein U1Q18_005073 [Sarracenia purpurea var. burkii]
MADGRGGYGQLQRATTPSGAAINHHHGTTFLHTPSSNQLTGFLTLLISGAILLLVIGLTITVAVLVLIFFSPVLVISSPIWLPVGLVLFFAVAGFLSLGGFGMVVLAALSWIYRYFRGFNHANLRIADTASHGKDYA